VPQSIPAFRYEKFLRIPGLALLGAHHVLEMFRRTLPNGLTRTCFDRLSNRLTKIVAEAKRLSTT
jgi:hypothetical protein